MVSARGLVVIGIVGILVVVGGVVLILFSSGAFGGNNNDNNGGGNNNDNNGGGNNKRFVISVGPKFVRINGRGGMEIVSESSSATTVKKEGNFLKVPSRSGKYLSVSGRRGTFARKDEAVTWQETSESGLVPVRDGLNLCPIDSDTFVTFETATPVPCSLKVLSLTEKKS